MLSKKMALERAFWKANKIGERVNLHEIIYSYKALNFIDHYEEDAIYNYLADRLGFSNEELLTDEQYQLLVDKGYL